MLIRPVIGQFQRHADLGLWGVHDYRHGFARFRDGFREMRQGFTVWDTFLEKTVTVFANGNPRVTKSVPILIIFVTLFCNFVPICSFVSRFWLKS